MAKSKIEWCDRVWNPVTGCTKVSPGCLNCYAERMVEIRSVLLNRNDRQYFNLEDVRRAGLDLLAEHNRRTLNGK